jgi:predicted transcriptional regulator
MSHIDQAIRVLEIMSSEVKPSKVPSFLEQVHKTLVSLSDKEASLSNTAKAAAPKSKKTKKKSSLASTAKAAAPKSKKTKKKSSLASTAKAVAPKAEKATKKAAPASTAKAVAPKAEKSTKKAAPASTAKAVAPKAEKSTKKAAPANTAKAVAPKAEKATKKPSTVSTAKAVAPKVEKATKKPSPASTAKAVVPKAGQAVKKVASAPKTNEGSSTPKKPKPFVSIKKSVTDDAIICLICGKPGKMIKKHLSMAHDVDEKGYREMFDLDEDYPFFAPASSRKRSKTAKKTGLGENKEKPLAAKKTAK